MSNGADDGGLPPGGVPEGLPCDCGPCPACRDDRHMSSHCVLQRGHGGSHRCEQGDAWVQASPSDAPQRDRCTAMCGTCGGQCRKDRVHSLPHWCGQHDF